MQRTSARPMAAIEALTQHTFIGSRHPFTSGAARRLEGPSMKKHHALSLTTILLVACTANTVEQPPPTPDAGPACSVDAPVCTPDCGAGRVCSFAAGSCGCVDLCDSTSPRCPGSGPNAGCAADELCNVNCACQAQPSCIPDAPRCAGSGPNAGCAADETCSSTCACVPGGQQTAGVLRRSSRSTPVDLTADDAIAAMVNEDDGSVSFFNVAAGQESRIARVATSREAASEPVSVVIHPDGKTAFVANRASGSVSRIRDIDGAQARLDGEIELDGEPMGLALSPTGAELWVTNWTAGEITIIDTTRFAVVRTLQVGGNPFAIAITNDGDTDDRDERAFVTQFFARPRAGVLDVEATDDGKEGVVLVIDLADPTRVREVSLAPIASCFTAAVNGNELTSGCFPNQLYGVTLHRAFGRLEAYVVSVGASPAGPVNFNHNVQAIVSVIDADAEVELPGKTQNLNVLVRAQVDNDGNEDTGRRFLNVPTAIDFVPRDDVAIGYVSAMGSDIVLRLEYREDGSLSIGAPNAFNIPVGQAPRGLVVKHGSRDAGAFVANQISRDLSILSFRDQRELSRVESTAQPADPRSEAFRVWRGKRFFNTSTGIWSREGWGSCLGCHPFGLSDNVTWSFAAGPRQTIALDGQYAPNDPRDMRALNWTAIFDETADFELNVRGVSGGRGAIQNEAGPLTSAAGATFQAIPAEDGTLENHQGLNGSLTFLARNTAVCTNANTCPDWDLVDAYIRSLESPRAPKRDPRIAEGRELFADAGCDKCHAGPKWTVSRTFYDPTSFTGALPQRVFAANRAFTTPVNAGPLVGLPLDVNRDATLIAGDDSEGSPAFRRQACNLRDVGTFGVGGAPEVRANGTAAMGERGFNPPSLLGLTVGAPFFHHGAAPDLEAIFEADFRAHFQAGNPNFNPTAGERAALVAFLRSIDTSTPPFPVLPGTELCPDAF